MKFTLSWLKDHLITKASLQEIVDTMIMLGLEVEHVENPGETLKAFTVAKVTEAVKHPDADKLNLCRVDTVDGEKQIVCGAPNARAGMTAIYAPLGTYIPGADFSLDAKPRKIRGVESHGMLCSAAELGLGEDHGGIIDLQGDFRVGMPAAEAMGVDDPVIEFEVTPNRPDWLGVVGIARDLAAAGLGRFRPQTPEPIAGSFPCPVKVEVETVTCPTFSGVLIRGAKNGPSPDWIQQRLRALGMTPKSLLVDVTNLVSIDRARPLHAYDAAKLKGTVRARDAEEGELFTALDGKAYELAEGMCAIADDSGVIGLGGVMGGASTAVTAETLDVFLEAAWFDPLTIARTGRATGIISDARYRFERGVDPLSQLDGLAMAAAIILEYGGGEISRPVTAGKPPVRTDKVAFAPRDVERLTGLKVKPADMRRMVKDLGFEVEDAGDTWYLAAPSWRHDVEQSADLVEEIARLVGYDQLPMSPLPRPSMPVPTATPMQERVRVGRRVLASLGYSEAVTWSFMRRDWAELFGGGEDGLVIANPVASDLDCMRPSALANLAQAAQRNVDRGAGEIRLFEAGPVYLDNGPKDQRWYLSALVRPAPQRHWSGPVAPADAYSVKADLLALLAALDQPAERFQVGPPRGDHWHPGQAATLKMGPKVTVASFGALHPRVLKALDVDGPAYGFELNLHALPVMKARLTKTRPVLDLPDQTPVTRDFAFLVPEATPAGDIVKAAAGVDKALIASVSVFDVYQGKGVPDGQKSVAFEVVIQPRGEALKDAEIEALMKKVIEAVTKATGGVLRG